jgi:hypothetical protein
MDEHVVVCADCAVLCVPDYRDDGYNVGVDAHAAPLHHRAKGGFSQYIVRGVNVISYDVLNVQHRPREFVYW